MDAYRITNLAKIRFPSRHFFGWHFLVGLLVFGAMTFMLVAISDQVMTGRPLTQLDAQLTDWARRHRTPALITFFKYVTALGSTFMGITLATISGVYLLRKHQLYRFTALVLSIAGGSILNHVLKSVFQRARPQFDDPIMSFAGYSFPSGHTMTATLLYGCLALLIMASTRSRAVRSVTAIIALLLIGLVAFSRIYLGAHYLTDVVAAIAEGLAWLSLCFTFVYSFWRERHL